MNETQIQTNLNAEVLVRHCRGGFRTGRCGLTAGNVVRVIFTDRNANGHEGVDINLNTLRSTSFGCWTLCDNI